MMAKNNAAMYDLNLLKLAGFNPKAIIPSKRLAGTEVNNDSADIFKILKKNDRQDAITRFVWYNLPKGLSGELIEKVLYLRGSGAFFKNKDKWYFLPYVLKSEGDSGIDCYSRYKKVSVVTMGSTEDKMIKLFGGKAYDVLYDIDDKMGKDVEDKTVLIFDYSPEFFTNAITPMSRLNDVLLRIESRLFPYAETAVLSKTGVRGLRTGNDQETEDVEGLNNNIKSGALNQKIYFGVKGAQDFQDFANNQTNDVSQYLELFQSLENFRKATYGSSTSGLMQKQSHMLENEAKMNQANNIAQGNDALYQRQWACVLFYSYTGIPIWCDIRKSANPEDNQTALVTDNKGDESNDNTK